jgi:REP element-mobilizing transposase RayT
VRHRHEELLWSVRVFVVMPDHIHLLIRMSDTAVLRQVITQWKRWTARQGGFKWQRDFFDHRLRSEESSREKAEYILQNPVRAGLCAKPEDWLHRWIGDWD